MNKGETRMVEAIRTGKEYREGNTSVSILETPDGKYHSAWVYLHGYEVAHYFWENEIGHWVLRLNDAGYMTRLTKSRLNALLTLTGEEINIKEVDEEWHYHMGANTYRWNGSHLFYANEPTTDN